MNEKTTLPKGWKHWCRLARLRPRDKGRDRRAHGQAAWFYLHGHGREWRVNCHNQIECGDTYEDFDRWARCDIQSAPMPRTRDEFLATVRQLLAAQAANAQTE